MNGVSGISLSNQVDTKNACTSTKGKIGEKTPRKRLNNRRHSNGQGICQRQRASDCTRQGNKADLFPVHVHIAPFRYVFFMNLYTYFVNSTQAANVEITRAAKSKRETTARFSASG